jgi:hypothetical protein
MAGASPSELDTTYFGSELIAVAMVDDELAYGGVGERGLPAAVGEGVAWIFLRSPGGLHHAVESKKRLNRELHVSADGSARGF